MKTAHKGLYCKPSEVVESSLKLILSKHKLLNITLAVCPSGFIIAFYGRSQRLFSRTARSQHVTPILQELHWLSIELGTAYKSNLVTFEALHVLSHVFVINTFTFVLFVTQTTFSNKVLSWSKSIPLHWTFGLERLTLHINEKVCDDTMLWFWKRTVDFNSTFRSVCSDRLLEKAVHLHLRQADSLQICKGFI